MEKFTQVLKDFWNDEEGLTLLEYILGAALIVSAMLSLGFWSTLGTEFKNIASDIKGLNE
ncbi:Flp family type IVb pilin [Vibrio sp. PNB22_8_1]|uniref:Flp family type IVb pilin n=1 Tax=unclassified Vibrio TaxID=2614977 RepID=UPI00406A1B9B